MPSLQPYNTRQDFPVWLIACCSVIYLLLRCSPTCCEHLDACSSGPCLTDQTCVTNEQSHKYYCYCNPGYTGSSCQIDCLQMRADIVFVMDSSLSHEIPNWYLALDKVTSLISSLDMRKRLTKRPSSLHFGLVVFSEETYVNIPLGQYEKEDLIPSVEELPLPSGTALDINTALKLLQSLIFGPDRQGDRPEVPNVVIFVTDGTSEMVGPVPEVGLRDAMLVYAAAVSEAVNMRHLVAITGNYTERVLRAGSFRSTSDVIDKLLTDICQSADLGESTTESTDLNDLIASIQTTSVTWSAKSAGPKELHEHPVASSGPQGYAGIPGQLGPRGPQGLPGSAGATGATGPAGQPGGVGMEGLIGPPGPNGTRGPMGHRGPPGERGPVGPAGDIDRSFSRCVLYDHVCEHKCVSMEFGYKCQCFPGYRLKDDKASCEEIDECSRNNGGCEHFCHVLEQSGHVCSCLQGFSLSADLRSCLDVDECCQPSFTPCMTWTHEKCVNTYGGYMCIPISPGYQLNLETGTVEKQVIGRGWNLVSREAMLCLLGWTTVLTLLLLLTILMTWLSDDLLLRTLIETRRRQKRLETKLPPEFYLFPKIDASRTRGASMEQLHGSRVRMGARDEVFETPVDTYQETKSLSGEPAMEVPQSAVSMNTLCGPCRGELALCPSMEVLPRMSTSSRYLTEL